MFASSQQFISRTTRVTALLSVAWASAVACSSSSETGVEATLVLSTLGEPVLHEGTRTFRTDQGYLVELSDGWLVLEHLELQPCVESSIAAFLRPAVAFAHSGGNPRRLASPILVELSQPATDQVLGVINPPAGRYCAFQQSVGPSDADTPGVTPEAVGKSLRLELTVTGGLLSDARSLLLESDVVFDGFYTLDPLDLDQRHRRATIRITHSGATWFDGIDFQSADEERVVQKFLRNFRDSVEVSWR